ncbi:MAG: dehydrogenase/reductase SDR family protein 7B [Saprospiraceae bacterium]|jgi:dehydrogenase/reductase SDR family protein 7B
MKEKIVWITGASSGIGAALAKEYHSKGASVILSARRTEKLNELALGLKERVAVLPMDVTKIDEVDSKHSEAVALFGPIDILINNAGISQRGAVVDTDIKVVQRIMEVNFIGNVAVTKSVLPSMIARKTGTIVVISSLVGKLSTPFRSTYSASKHALHGYYDALRAEVASDGLQITVVCPGYIQTEISVHALNGKGGKHGVMDQNQEAGMEVNKCAKNIYKAVLSGKREFLVGGKETNYVLIRRFLPSMYHWLIAKMAKEKRF